MCFLYYRFSISVFKVHLLKNLIAAETAFRSFYGKNMFVSPINCQTFRFAIETDCNDTFKNLFQLDWENMDSWYHLIPAPVPFEDPTVCAPQQNGYIKNSLCRTLQCKQIEEFWRTILHKSVSNSFCEKIFFEHCFKTHILTIVNSVSIAPQVLKISYI